jgi:hypothetical protein
MPLYAHVVIDEGILIDDGGKGFTSIGARALRQTTPGRIDLESGKLNKPGSCGRGWVILIGHTFVLPLQAIAYVMLADV